jgi:MbtH protein
MKDDDREDTKYRVVVNHEEQYSIWAADRPNPPGWRDAPKSGSKSECLAYIKDVWTDMRPLSLRNQMDVRTSVVSEGPLPQTPVPQRSRG